MFTQSPLPFIEHYLEALETELKQLYPQRCLSRTQKHWLNAAWAAYVNGLERKHC